MANANQNTVNFSDSLKGVAVSVQAHAQNEQKVTITDGTNTATFTGAGEGTNQMGSVMTDSAGNEVYLFPSYSGKSSFTITFQNSTDGGSTWKDSVAGQIATFDQPCAHGNKGNIIEVIADCEDSAPGNSDYNDAVVTMVAIKQYYSANT